MVDKQMDNVSLSHHCFTLLRVVLSLFAAFFLCYELYAQCSSKNILELLGLVSIDYFPFFVAVVLVIVNWSLESLRWMLSVRLLQDYTFKEAVVAVLVGLVSGLVTPSRVGEFVGRLFNVSKSNRKCASFLWAYGSTLVTIAIFIFGGVSIISFSHSYPVRLFKLSSVPSISSPVVLICLILLVVFVPILSFFKAKMFDFIQHIRGVVTLPFSIRLFILAAVRYLVFSLQFALMMKAFRIDLPLSVLWVSSMVSYFVVTFVPSFFFTDAIVRSSVAVVVLSSLTTNTVSVLLASFCVWIVNVAIPTLFGCLFFANGREKSRRE